MSAEEISGKHHCRIHWLDNLRSFMIFLVVVGHASLIYERYSLGKDWWIVVDPAGNDVPGIVFLIINIFVIATIFFVSGFFTQMSLGKKAGWEFINAKFKRLMIPWAIAVFTLIPAYKFLFLYSRGLPQEDWTTYFHWDALWSQNWLWFLPVLFLFAMIYLGMSKLPVNLSNITLKQGIRGTILLCIVYSFCMDFFGLHGWTKSFLIDFQNERILIYFLVYLLGALFYEHDFFTRFSKNRKLDTIFHCTGWIPINLYIFALIYSLAKPGQPLISKAIDTMVLRTSFVFALAYLLYAMISTFWFYLNKQGRIINELNRNSYYVYIIHLVVMGGIAVSMLNTGIPSLAKFAILIVSAFLASNLIVSLSRKAFKRVRLVGKTSS